jgi:hypothetical protein
MNHKAQSVTPLPGESHDPHLNDLNDETIWKKVEHQKKPRIFMTREKRSQLLGRAEKAEPYNLDMYQLKKIQGIIERVAVRKKTSRDYDPSLTRSEIRMLQLEEIVVEENETYKKNRATSCGAGPSIRYAITADEMLLRQMHHRQGLNAIHFRDPYNGRNALHEAVGQGHLHIVKMMLDEFRANPNISTLLGSTSALHIACEKGLRQMASLLITYGAELNCRDSRGCTPLHVCSTKPCVKLLMRYPSMDATIKNNEGLFASEHYWKYTEEDDRIAEIQTVLMREEDRQQREKMRLEREMHKAMFAESQGERDEYPLATSQNSSIITEKGPKGLKNAYKFEEARRKEKEKEKGRKGKKIQKIPQKPVDHGNDGDAGDDSDDD